MSLHRADEEGSVSLERRVGASSTAIKFRDRARRHVRTTQVGLRGAEGSGGMYGARRKAPHRLPASPNPHWVSVAQRKETDFDRFGLIEPALPMIRQNRHELRPVPESKCARAGLGEWKIRFVRIGCRRKIAPRRSRWWKSAGFGRVFHRCLKPNLFGDFLKKRD